MGGVSQVPYLLSAFRWLYLLGATRSVMTMAQPNKGDRHIIGGRIPRSYEAKLTEYVQDTGNSRSDLIAQLVCDFLDQYQPQKDLGQEELPLREAS